MGNIGNGTIFMVVFISGHFILHYLSTKLPQLSSGEYTECSSLHLKRGYYWCLLTATCFHADLGHLLYNMVYYTMIGFELLSVLDYCIPLTLAIYFGSGVVAWLASLVINKFKYGEMSDLVWSLGASPATYGSAIFLAIVQPTILVAGKGGESINEGNFKNLILPNLDSPVSLGKFILQLVKFCHQPFFWVATLVCIQGYFTSSSKKNKNVFSLFNLNYHFFILPLIFSISYYTLAFKEWFRLTSLNFLLFTMGKNFIFAFYWKIIKQLEIYREKYTKYTDNMGVWNDKRNEDASFKSIVTGTDDLAHLFGSLAGLVFGILYKVIQFQKTNNEMNSEQSENSSNFLDMLILSSKNIYSNILVILPDSEILLWIILYLGLLIYLGILKIWRA